MPCVEQVAVAGLTTGLRFPASVVSFARNARFPVAIEPKLTPHSMVGAPEFGAPKELYWLNVEVPIECESQEQAVFHEENDPPETPASCQT